MNKFKEDIRNLLRVYFLRNQKSKEIIRIIESSKYLGSNVWNNKEGNLKLYKAINSGLPQAIGKIGSAELFAVRRYLRYRDYPNISELTLRDRMTLGLYPNDIKILEQYSYMMTKNVLPALTMIGVWFNYGEASIIRKYARKAIKIPMLSLESYIFENEPWTKSLEGKNVLVISPFVKTIEKQYEKRLKIWKNRENILPQFNLKLIRAPYHISLEPANYNNWFEELENLKSKMTETQFDIALIGALVFSLPLATHAKKLGNQGVHLGGATQIYFGIKGKRWEKNPIISNFYNDYWIHPLSEEVPKNYSRIENGAYW